MGAIFLHGGGEFTGGCAECDRALLHRVHGGAVVVLPLAAETAEAYAHTAHVGAAWFDSLGGSAAAAPDPADDLAGALAAVRRARMLVLPGGSPTRLLERLAETGLDELVCLLAERDDTVVYGASAGAMALCGWTYLPDAEGGARVAPGLGVLPDFAVVPHWTGGQRDWVDALRAQQADLDLLGVPERSGVLVEGARVLALGETPTTLLTPDGDELLALDADPDDS